MEDLISWPRKFIYEGSLHVLFVLFLVETIIIYFYSDFLTFKRVRFYKWRLLDVIWFLLDSLEFKRCLSCFRYVARENGKRVSDLADSTRNK